MNDPSLQSFFAWLTAHPHWAGAAVFLIALTESLVVVGLVVPGTVLMLGIGALIAFEALEFTATWAWAAAGAVVGDGLSYWLGRHFRHELRERWPFRAHPRLLQRSEDFFQRHGGKSVFLGRFVGPIRPIIPAVAGMFRMPAGRFAAINVGSAILWAPAYLLPGMAVGASLALAAAVATRLVVVLVGLVAIVLVVVWLLRHALGYIHHHASRMIDAAQRQAQRHPRLGRLALGLIDPHHPEFRSLAVLALLLLGAAWAFFGLLLHTLGGEGPGPVDAAVYEALQAVRTPWADQLLVAVTQLGGVRVYLPLSLGVLAFLAARRRWTAAGHWLAAVGFGLIATQTLKWLVAAPRPVDVFAGTSAFAFPSGHTSMSTVVYGFLAVLVARELPPARRWIPYAAAVIVATPIAFSRLYLGAHWLSDVLGGATLGLAWVALLGIAYRHHTTTPLDYRALAATALGVLVAAGTWEVSQNFRGERERYAPRVQMRTLAPAHWWTGQWRGLPAWRDDLWPGVRRPLTVQWAGEPATLERALRAHGWRSADRPTVTGLLGMLSPQARVADLPVFPRVHAGRHEARILVRPARDPAQRDVLRLWPSAVRAGDTPVWVGTVTRQRQRRTVGLVSYPHTLADATAPLAHLRDDLAATPGLELAVRPRDAHTVLLVRPAGS